MQLKILNKKYQYENNTEAIAKLLDQINEELNNTDQYISHLIIDGTEVYDNFEEVLLGNVQLIKCVEVKTKSLDEFIHDSLLMTNEYLERALPEVETLADEFYQGISENTWDKFAQFIEGIQWIYQMLCALSESRSLMLKNYSFNVIKENIEQGITELEDCVKNQDYVLAGDIIQYELVSSLKSLKDEIESHYSNRENLTYAGRE